MAVGEIVVGSDLTKAASLMNSRTKVAANQVGNLVFWNSALYEAGVNLAMMVGVFSGLATGWGLGWSWLPVGYVVGAFVTCFAWAALAVLGNRS